MTRLSLVHKTVRDYQIATIAIGAVNILMAVFVVLIYPSYRDQLAGFEVPEAFRGFLGEAGTWTSPEGFLAAEFFSWVPLLVITLAIIGGTATLAAEESAGTMDLLLAQPIPRRRLVLEKAAGLGLVIIVATLVSFVGFLAGAVFVEIDMPLSRLWSAVVSMVPIALLFLTFSLWASAAWGNRGLAAALAIGIVVVAYMLNTVGATVEVLAAPRKLSPFYWSDSSRVLLHGFDWLRSAAILSLAAAFLALAVWSFERRDIAAGAREWGRLPFWRAPQRRPPTAEPASESVEAA